MCLHPKCIKCEDINCIRGVKDQGNTVLVEPSRSDTVEDQQNQAGEGKQPSAPPDAGACWETVAQVEVLLSVWDFRFISQRRNLLNCMHTSVLLVFVLILVRRGSSCHRPLFFFLFCDQYLASVILHLAFFSSICHDPDCLLEQ